MSTKEVQHFLAIYNGVTEELHSVKRISHFDLSDFANQFDVDLCSDPDMHDRYAVGPDEVGFLEKYIEQLPHFDFSKYGYFIEAMKDDVAEG